MYLHRYLCDVLEEMRQCVKTQNYSYLPGLIEEAQSMGNRMEAKLHEINDLNSLRKDIKELEEKRNKLKEEVEKKESDGK